MNKLKRKWISWPRHVTAHKFPISEVLLQERALNFATDFGNNDFKASNGWLGSFLPRHNVAFITWKWRLDNSITDNSKQKLPSLLEDYDPKDIFNMDKTGLFFWQTKNQTIFERGEKCSGGKKVKLQFTISLCLGVLGEKVKPLVIWKYANSHCFKGIKKDQLSVEYYSNQNAWMTSGLFETWLKNLDHKIAFKKKDIVIFRQCVIPPSSWAQ